MDNLWLPVRPARPVVQTDHVVTSRRTISEVHADGWISPLIDTVLAAEPAEERVVLLFADRENAVNSDVIMRPQCRFACTVACSARNSSVLKPHQLNVGLWESVVEFEFYVANGPVSEGRLDVFLYCVLGVLPELREIEVGEGCSRGLKPRTAGPRARHGHRAEVRRRDDFNDPGVRLRIAAALLLLQGG